MSNLIAQKTLSGTSVDVGFSSNIFMVFGLPTRRLAGNPAFWTKKTSLCELTITRNHDFEIPWGCYARMNQIYIDTEVRSKNTNIIDVGQSFREYTQRIGYKDGRANRALLKQLLNYITSAIYIKPGTIEPGHAVGIQTLIANVWDIHFDVHNPEQLMFSKGKIILEEKYASYVHKHAVPLEWEKKLKNCTPKTAKKNGTGSSIHSTPGTPSRTNEMTNKTIGIYARVSTDRQNIETQLLELRCYCHARGFQAIEYVDQGFGGSLEEDKRPALKSLMADARRRKISAVVVWDFSRFARSLRQLVDALDHFRTRGISFISLREGADTDTANGRLMFGIFASLAEFERELIRERILIGLKRARMRGKVPGPRRNPVDPVRFKQEVAKGLSLRRLAAHFGVSKDTVRSLIKSPDEKVLTKISF